MRKLGDDDDNDSVLVSNTRSDGADAFTSNSELLLPLPLRKFAHEQLRCDTSAATSGDSDRRDENAKQAAVAATRPALHLRMASCSISPESVASLSNFVAQLNTRLVRLSLSKNAIGPQGLQLLGKALVTNNSLEVLELDSCELVGSPLRPQLDGLLALSKGIQSPRSTLHHLNVANNDLQPEGCRILLGAISFHPTLTALDISSNMLGLFNEKQGYLALSYVLQFARRLCWLSISDNPLPKHAVPVLREALAANVSLTCLFARGCDVRREQFVETESPKSLGALERLWYV